MRQIHRRIVKEGRVALSQFFQMGMHKTAIIGMFLSILELVRHHGVDAVQDNVGGDIWVTAGQRFRPDIDISNVEEYDHKKPKRRDMLSDKNAVAIKRSPDFDLPKELKSELGWKD